MFLCMLKSWHWMHFHSSNCRSSNKRRYLKPSTTCIGRKASNHNSVSSWVIWSASHLNSTKSSKNTQLISISLKNWHLLRKIINVSLRHWLQSQESLIAMREIRRNWEVRILYSWCLIMPPMRRTLNLWLRKLSMHWPIWSAKTNKFSGRTLNCKLKKKLSKCFRILPSSKPQTRPVSNKFSGF